MKISSVAKVLQIVLVFLGLALTALPAYAFIHPGDKLEIVIYNHPELSTQAVVAADGHISLPLVGQVDTAKLGLKELGVKIAQELGRYVRYASAHVDLLAQSQTLFISGGPGGVLPYLSGTTLVSAVSQAEQVLAQSNATAPGINSVNPPRDALHGRIDLHVVSIVRDDQRLGPYDVAALIAAGQPGVLLMPGDTIVLADKPLALTVLGEIREPGVVHLDHEEPLNNALVQAGGVNTDTASSEMLLTRDGKNIRVTYSSPEMLSPARAGDILLVPHAPRVNVVGQVMKPGEVVLHGEPSLLGALYSAGGPMEYGDIRNVQVNHQGQTHKYNIAALQHGKESQDQNPNLSDGDIVYVPENHKISFTRLFQLMSAGSLFYRF